MHLGSPSAAPSLPSTSLRSRPSKQAGFSLVEVTMAIGIIAFAFVALLGLIPTGLQVFRESVDSANEMWIAQNLNSMIQVTPWSEVEKLEKYTFYFDEEGRLTDRTSPDDGSTATPETELKRLYAVKVVFGQQSRPGDSSNSSASGPAGYSNNVLSAVAVIAPYLNPKAMEAFNAVTKADDVHSITKSSGIKTRAFLVARMDSMKE